MLISSMLRTIRVVIIKLEFEDVCNNHIQVCRGLCGSIGPYIAMCNSLTTRMSGRAKDDAYQREKLTSTGIVSLPNSMVANSISVGKPTGTIEQMCIKAKVYIRIVVICYVLTCIYVTSNIVLTHTYGCVLSSSNYMSFNHSRAYKVE
jgi:hypothetical protein